MTAFVLLAPNPPPNVLCTKWLGFLNILVKLLVLKYDNPFDGCLPTGVLPAAEVVVAFSLASGFVGVVVEMVPPNEGL